MNSFLEAYIEGLEKADTVKKFEELVIELNERMQKENVEFELIQNVRAKAKYFDNKFSDMSTKENMIKAKDNLVRYLKDVSLDKNIHSQKSALICLEKYLDNFYLFLEAFRETRPDKRSTLTIEKLEAIQIKNEYDLQHILYSVLKPLYKDIRKEVTEDSGVGAIRSDIKIDSINSIVEAKCTRQTMSLKKLTEEIEADIVHYEADFLYFYVYDKEKVIKDKHNFETKFRREFGSKRVACFVLQPVCM